MVAENFLPSLGAVLVHEGGYSNDAHDPGGVTLEGVIQSVYNTYRRSKGLLVQPLTRAMLGTAAWISERNEIYLTRYWNLIKGDRLPAGLDYVLFDGCVNSGAAQVTKWLQRALGDVGISGVRVDGVLGEETLEAISRVEDIDALIARIQARRLAMLQALKTWKYFGRGWGRRVAEAKALGQALATGSVQLPIPASWAGAKGYVSDAKVAPPRAPGDALAAGGVVQTTLASVTDAVAPVADRLPSAATVLTVLMVVGALATVAGIAYRVWASRRGKQLADALDITTPAQGAPA